MSNAAEFGSRPCRCRATNCVAYEATTKITPPMTVTRTIALGMVRFGSLVSSVSVVIASKPRNEYAAIAAPAATPETVVVELPNGCAREHRVARRRWTATWRNERITKNSSTRTCIAISSRFTLAASLMPITFSAVVSAMNSRIHSHVGTPGNWRCRKDAPISQITIGRKK